MPQTDAPIRPRRALISVSDKTGLPALATALTRHGIEILSTGGTAAALRATGVPVRDVASVTEFPEILGGRVKTLHPRIHGGILARRAVEADRAQLAEWGIEPIDIVIVNLYPFEATLASGAEADRCIEEIDIGGPAMIRAAAKAHADVTVITDAEDYQALADRLEAGGGLIDGDFRRRMAAIAFARTAAYDAAIAAWMADRAGETPPRRRVLAGRLVEALRYGENPHQSGAFYATAETGPGIATARQLQGKALSYNNINDADAALELAGEFDPAEGPACVIVKHANPCGVARADTLAEAYRRAHDCDRVSAFGGIIAVNTTLDADTARAIAAIFTELVIAPEASPEAVAILSRKPNLRLLVTGGLPASHRAGLAWRQVGGGFLVQDRDAGTVGPAGVRVVSARQPDPHEMDDMLFAWRVAKHVKSNAIVYARDGATVGIGAGQMSRVDSTRIAARKAADMAEALGLDRLPTEGAVVASDAFFPFADGVLAAAEAGATALIQPGGSVRDAEVIAAADAAGLAMVFTDMRHFRH